MHTVYVKKQFKIYKAPKGDGFIIHNSRKEFEKGHTHVKNFKTATYIIDLALNYTVPDRLSNQYLLTSIVRISTNKSYIEKIERKKLSVMK